MSRKNCLPTDKADIVKNVKAMFMHRFGGVVVNGTDNLVISALFGVVSVGLYSNYYLISLEADRYHDADFQRNHGERWEPWSDGRRQKILPYLSCGEFRRLLDFQLLLDLPFLPL